MYNGNGGTGEYIEFTNMGDSAVDFSGWSFDDDSRLAGTVSLSRFAVVNPGQAVILTEAAAEDFRSVWSLSADIRIVGNNSANLGRADEINLFDAGNNLVERLTYGDQVFAGSLRAQVARGCVVDDFGLGRTGTDRSPQDRVAQRLVSDPWFRGVADPSQPCISCV